MALLRFLRRARLPQPCRRAVIAMVVIAVLARLGAIGLATLEPLAGDPLAYHRIATSYLQGGTFLQVSLAAEFGLQDAASNDTPGLEPLHSFAIGYPAYLAAVYRIFGDDAAGRLAALAVLAVLAGLLIPPVTLSIYRDLGGSSGTGAWLALGLAAFWPEAFTMAPELLSENLAVVLFAPWLWLICGMLAGRTPRSGKHLAAAGLLGGLLFLVRAEFLPLIVTGALLAGLHPREEPVDAPKAGYRLRPTLIVLAVALPFLVFPTVRNYRNYGEYIPLTTVAGNNFWLGALDNKAFFAREDPLGEVRQIYVPGKPAQTGRNFYRAGLAWIARNPINYVLRMIQRFFMMNFHAHGEPAIIGKPWYLWIERFLLRFSRVLLVPLFLLGLWFAAGRRPIIWFLFGIYAYEFLLLHLFFDARPRMFHPIHFLVIAVAAVMLDIYFWRPSGDPAGDNPPEIESAPA